MRWGHEARVLALAAVAAAGAALPASGAQVSPPVSAALFSAMHWRCVGPFRGGRALTVTGVPGDPNRFYFGAVGGGVWESHNAGRTWQPVFDQEPVASIGAIAVAPSDPDTIYVGTGEADMRSDISYGDGIYKSTDGGKTWARLGLEGTRQIGKILVDPRNPGILFVAALGHAYGPNPERGVFRSTDGGKSWAKVLFTNDDTGAIDLAFDPVNSSVLYASLWQTRRPPWNVYPPSNGSGSGLYRSTDGGTTWSQITGHGFPSEDLGRIGIAVAPSDHDRIYAIVDAKDGGLYRSDDGGATWAQVSRDHRIWERGWYFGAVSVDPKNPDIVYVCDTAIYRSVDGGRTFVPFKGAPGGDDYHELWIAPGNPDRMILASDQGAVVSLDGGATWSSWYNQPTAQLYHVITDESFPYRIYGAQQDSGAAVTPERGDDAGITPFDWRPISVGGENGYLAPDPLHPGIIFGGTVSRFDMTTLQDQSVDPELAYPGSYRHTWTLPLVFSRTDPHVLYFGAQEMFRSDDGGGHWTIISPDLSRKNPETPPNLDPLTAKDAAVAGPRRGVIYAIAPSPIKAHEIWAGTDDGQVWITEDEGKNWSNVTPRGMTPWSKVGIIEASHFDPATAYIAVDRHRLDDLQPYIYVTHDSGREWQLITRGIPDGAYVNVVREDPVRRHLLYAGTETGIFVSLDSGAHWQSLQLDLPHCPIRDMDIHGTDLVIATHGRSFWVLDDIEPLREVSPEMESRGAYLFAPRPAVRLHPAGFQGTPLPKDEPVGENPPAGAILDYFLARPVSGEVTLEILDAKGVPVRRYSSTEKVKAPDVSRIAVTPNWVKTGEPLPATAGLHRFVWDLHYATAVPGPSFFGNSGLWAPPGTYTVKLTAGGQTLEKSLSVQKDPRVPATVADLQAQFALARAIESARGEAARALASAQTLRHEAEERRKAASGPAGDALDQLTKKIDETAGIVPHSEMAFFLEGSGAGATIEQAAMSLLTLKYAVESADTAPTSDERTGFDRERRALDQALSGWKAITVETVPAVNKALREAHLAPLAASKEP